MRRRSYGVVFLIVITVNFFLPRLMPGDPFVFLSAESNDLNIVYSDEQIASYRAYYGLDRPLVAQYVSYLTGLARGYLGYSIYYNRDVTEMILARLPWTLSIVALSLVTSSVVGTVLGALSAWMRDSGVDRVLYAGLIVVSEVPAFLVGILLLFVLGARLRLFPLSGGATAFADYAGPFDRLGDLARHAALPVMTLVIARIGEFYLHARAGMVDVLSRAYILTAHAKGLSGRRIVFRHALRNALPPVIARVFMSFGMLLGGAVVVENVFDYPGLGRLMRDAVSVRDYVLIQGVFFVTTIMVLLMSVLADLVYAKLDPRVRTDRRG